MISLLMTRRHIGYIFDEFEREIDRQNLKWIPAKNDDWKELNNFLTSDSIGNLIDILINETCAYFKDRETDKYIIISRDKNSFIDFLLYVNEREEKEKEMITTSNTATVTVNPNTNSTSYTYTTTPDYTTDYIYTTNTPWQHNGTIVVNDNGIFIDGKKVLTEDEQKMNTKDFNLNFDFGPMKSKAVAISPFGIAIKNSNNDNYCYYNPNTCEVVDCTPFTFDTSKFLFKMPVAVSAVAIGDVIIHRGVPMFVKGYQDEEGRFCVIDVAAAEEKYILPVKNMFGFNFVTKIVSLMDMKNNGADAENPFGNILPFLLMSNESSDLDPMMLLMWSCPNGNIPANGSLTQNPLLMYLLMKDNKNMKDILPFLMMQSSMPIGVN